MRRRRQSDDHGSPSSRSRSVITAVESQIRVLEVLDPGRPSSLVFPRSIPLLVQRRLEQGSGRIASGASCAMVLPLPYRSVNIRFFSIFLSLLFSLGPSGHSSPRQPHMHASVPRRRRRWCTTAREQEHGPSKVHARSTSSPTVSCHGRPALDHGSTRG